MNIKELAEKYKLHQDDFWELSQRKGTWIIKHDACEKIAAIEKITFAKPDVHFGLEAICLIGEATMADETLWATGEASAVNVMGQGKYYWAMAEKRLKDRLILKLIHAYEYGIYSEEEADGFKNDKPEGLVHQNGVVSKPTPNMQGKTQGELILIKAQTLLNKRTATIEEVEEFIAGIKRTENLTEEEKAEWLPKLVEKLLKVQNATN